MICHVSDAFELRKQTVYLCDFMSGKRNPVRAALTSIYIYYILYMSQLSLPTASILACQLVALVTFSRPFSVFHPRRR